MLRATLDQGWRVTLKTWEWPGDKARPRVDDQVALPCTYVYMCIGWVSEFHTFFTELYEMYEVLSPLDSESIGYLCHTVKQHFYGIKNCESVKVGLLKKFSVWYDKKIYATITWLQRSRMKNAALQCIILWQSIALKLYSMPLSTECVHCCLVLGCEDWGTASEAGAHGKGVSLSSQQGGLRSRR